MTTPQQVLVLGAGGGSDVLLARYHRAARIDAVEVNGQLADLVNEDLAAFSGAPLSAAGVQLHIAEARAFVSRSEDRFDLVQVSLLDSFGAASAGLHSLSENYLYTVESLTALIGVLEPGGMLSMTRWLRLPPRDSIKLFATAVAALREAGVAEPGRHLALVRGWNTATLLVSRGALTPEQVGRIRAFCEERWFDLAWLPGMRRDEANRFNRLQEPWLSDAAHALLGTEPNSFFSAYKFDVRPATDDRPYFFHFAKWRALPEILSKRGQGGLPLLEQGYFVLVVALAQAVLASVLLILLPLWAGARGRGGRDNGQARPGRGRLVLYFLAIGFAFMLVEIAFIQKFILFLGHPVYAVAVVLAAFLVFAGIGSALVTRMTSRLATRPAFAAGGIAVVVLVYLAVLPPLFAALAGLTDWAKIVVSAGLIAPLAILMGVPFPLGLSRVARSAPARIPWAWGINGCASVIAAGGASAAAVHLGFTAVLLLALALYGVAAALPPKWASM